MTGRRLTISALLCADERPPDLPPATNSPSPPSTTFISHTLGLSNNSGDLRDSQARSAAPVESSHNAFHSRSYPDNSRDSHSLVPLSLQRAEFSRQSPSPPSGHNSDAYRTRGRAHRDSAPDRLQTLASTSESLVPLISREPHLSSNNNPYPLSQVAPQSFFTSRRSSESYRDYHSVESSSYFSRPISSRSAHSDPQIPAYTFPPPLPPHHLSYSPHQSFSAIPSSSPSRNPPSPVAVRRPSRSLSDVYPLMSQATSYGESGLNSRAGQSPVPSQSPLVTSASGSPMLLREQPYTAPASHVRSVSHSHPDSPPSAPPRTSSAAELPSLLNTESTGSPVIPFTSHGSPGGLGALEALVQVATEERRRLSGEVSTPYERKESARKASLSPVLNRVPPPLPPSSLPSSSVPPSSQSPVHQRYPPLPSPRLDARVSSLAFISLGQSHSQDGEPPSKKRRRTESAASGASSALSMPAPKAAAPPSPSASATTRPRSISQLLAAEPLSGDHHSHPDAPLSEQPLPAIAASAVEGGPHGTHHSPPDTVTTAKETEKPSFGGSGLTVVSAPNLARLEGDIVKTEEEPSIALTASVPGDRMSESSSNSQSSVKVQDQRDDPEQDAHEWLLEHYATEPPANVSIRPSPAPEDPPDSPNTTASATPSSAKREEVHDADVLPPEPSSKSKQPKVPSRTPTPLALLEEELDRATPGEGGLPSIAVSPGSDADLALELDLAAGASEHPAAPGTDTSTNNDLDDELLSLLDDKPRHSHSHSYPHSSKASHAASGSTNADKTSVVKDISIKKTSATPAPRLAPTTCAPSERVVMPPPVAPPNQATKSTAGDQQSAARQDKSEALSASSNMKKKEASAKAQKSKQPVKPKPKATTAKLSKAKTAKDDTLGCSGRLTPSGSGTAAKGKRAGVSASAGAAAAAKRSVSAAVGQSRSRSASVMPALPDPHNSKQQAEEEEEEEEEAIDDKLYCICKTSYDEDRVMIACDRCDEWYHTQCLNMNDLEVDLIDQFVCPPCIKANPHLPLKTTYKQRCYAGLKHPRPSSAAACHKPARGAFSKYCSDECGIAYMQRRIDGWGGDQEVLWASVREVKQREGVVVKVHVIEEEPGGAPGSEQKPAGAGGLSQLVMETHEVQKPTKTQYERTVTRLQAELYKIAPKREVLKRELEIILWRRKLLELAAERAERLGECGWDQRLCLDDDEYAEYAAGILESYDEGNGQANGEQSAMQVDGSGVEDGAWWCRGKKKCQRHAGWQKLRASEFEFDQELKEKAMSALTTQEREIRKQLEDAISLHNQKTAINMQSSPLRPLNGHAQANGAVKAKPNGTGKKGKQKR